MKKTLLVLCLLALPVAAFAMGNVPASSTLPGFTLQDTAGNTVNYDSYRNNNVVLVAFFTTWCPWCQDEMPLLESLYKKYKSKGFQVVGIGIEETRESLLAFTETKKITFKVLMDPDGKVATAYGVTKIPALFLVDKTGTVRFKSLYVTVGTLENEINKVLQ